WKFFRFFIYKFTSFNITSFIHKIFFANQIITIFNFHIFIPPIYYILNYYNYHFYYYNTKAQVTIIVVIIIYKIQKSSKVFICFLLLIFFIQVGVVDKELELSFS